jgi:hypothetical protein
MMRESVLCEAMAQPVPGFCLAPLGLSENDCRDITGFVQSTAPGWQTDREEDAFGQLGLIMAPCKTNRLQLSLIAYRIDAMWFLDEVLGGTLRDAGEFETLEELLQALGSRLRHCPANSRGDCSDCSDRPD